MPKKLWLRNIFSMIREQANIVLLVEPNGPYEYEPNRTITFTCLTLKCHIPIYVYIESLCQYVNIAATSSYSFPFFLISLSFHSSSGKNWTMWFFVSHRVMLLLEMFFLHVLSISGGHVEFPKSSRKWRHVYGFRSESRRHCRFVATEGYDVTSGTQECPGVSLNKKKIFLS